MVDSNKPTAPATDVAASIREAVRSNTSRDPLIETQRGDRAAVMAFLIEMHQRRTSNSAWTPREQLLAEYVMQWADQL